MKSALFIVLSSLHFASINGFGQNIINNPDFEINTSYPVSSGQIEKCQFWDGLVYTPDFYYSGYFNPVYPEYGGPKSGNAFIGLGTDNNDPGGGEAIGQDVSSFNIPVGAIIDFGFYAKQDTWFVGSCVGIEIYGFENPQTSLSGINYLGDYPDAVLLWSSSIITDTTWQYFDGAITSPISLSYFAISVSSTANCNQYVYVDSLFAKVEDLGIFSTSIEKQWHAFPNPAGDFVTIEFTNEINFESCDFVVYNLLGEEFLLDYKILENRLILNLTELPSGLFFFRLYGEAVEVKGTIVKSH